MQEGLSAATTDACRKQHRLDPMAQPATLLLTRPKAASERFAQQVFASLGKMPVLYAPLVKIEHLSISQMPHSGTLVFTSRNGVEAWTGAKLPCYCVGQATADRARALGFDPFVSGGTVEYLLDDLLKQRPKGAIFHIHGRHTRGKLAERLGDAGLNAQGIVGYEQRLLALPETAQDLLKGGAQVIVPLFSPRIAEHFSSFGPFGSQVKLIAISKSAAVTCRGALIAPSPNAEGMISAISTVLPT